MLVKRLSCYVTCVFVVAFSVVLFASSFKQSWNVFSVCVIFKTRPKRLFLWILLFSGSFFVIFSFLSKKQQTRQKKLQNIKTPQFCFSISAVVFTNRVAILWGQA